MRRFRLFVSCDVAPWEPKDDSAPNQDRYQWPFQMTVDRRGCRKGAGIRGLAVGSGGRLGGSVRRASQVQTAASLLFATTSRRSALSTRSASGAAPSVSAASNEKCASGWSPSPSGVSTKAIDHLGNNRDSGLVCSRI